MMLKSLDYEVEAYNWIPIVSFSFILFISSWAVATISITVVAELMPVQLREFGVSFCVSLFSVCAFVVVKCFPLVASSIGYHGAMFFFASVCLSGAVFIIVFLPETKGKSYEEVMNSLR